MGVCRCRGLPGYGDGARVWGFDGSGSGLGVWMGWDFIVSSYHRFFASFSVSCDTPTRLRRDVGNFSLFASRPSFFPSAISEVLLIFSSSSEIVSSGPPSSAYSANSTSTRTPKVTAGSNA